ncbi:NAD(P)-binding protein [Ophiobolus disseminans]|uniref:NAD(P)-binding protein n=1 Tax=Ophiobolus disseminans TaxID=1469910 RepID=A0A6A6ZVM2_9PLEO|nr:NAD(P)-binding protein [Ophiobolus disseminans]
MPFHPDSLPDLTGRVYIVTGATTGIGFHTAARLAQHHAHVYICARSAPKGETTTSRILTLYPFAKISVLVMDHTRLATVVAAAKHFLQQKTCLHGLVNNAGIMSTPYALTEDSYEEQWQTNYLAHWVFTSHLLPLMLSTSKTTEPGTVRIVNLSSSGHYGAPKNGINFADTSLPGEKGMTRYGQSKLANILHAKTLHTLYGPTSPSSLAGQGEIWVSAVHPGFVKSDLGNRAELPGLMWAVIVPYRWIGGEIDADTGAWTSLHCVAGEGMRREECGGYWQRIADPKGWQSGLARDWGLAERLEGWTGEEMRRGGWVE